MQSRKILHLISQSHLDPVWLWPLRDGAAEALGTLQSAVDRAAETPAFRYTRSSALTYRWARERDPRLFARIRELVACERWEVIGGWVVQADCNLPSDESFFRQALYAKSFFGREFGPAGDSAIGYAPDAFGHAGALPQILRHSGFAAWVFMRPGAEEAGLPLLFQWEGADGSRVLGVRIPTQYSQSYAATADDVEQRIRQAADGHFAPGFDHGPFWLGIGNHGGGPTRAHIARILELQQDESLPELRFSTVRDFIAAVRAADAFAGLPVVRGELGFPFRGCYAATAEVKRSNRRAEKALFAAEALAVRDGVGAVHDLDEAWWRLLLNQFHDILAGTCVAGVQDEIRARHGAVLTTAAEARETHAARIARRVDTTGESGSVLCAVNPLPWSRRALVHFDTFREPNAAVEILALENRDGSRRHPIQWLDADANFGPYGQRWGKLTARLDLPAGGYEVFRVVTRPLAPRAPAPEAAPEDPCNPQFSRPAPSEPDTPAGLGREPVLVSLQNPSGAEMLDAAVGTVVIEDPGGTWGHGIDAYDRAMGRPEIFESEGIADGGLLTCRREKTRWGRSEIWMDVTRFAHTEAVAVRFRILWLEKRALLKLEIPLAADITDVCAKMPAEAVRRPADGREYPMHDWLRIETAAGALGIINDGTYSYDARDRRVRCVLARGVPFAEHPPFIYPDTRNVALTDQHWLEQRFLLVPGAPGTGALDRQAQEFQVEAEIVPDAGHAGAWPWQGEGLCVGPDAIRVLAVKPARDGNGIVVRIQEFSGLGETARIAWADRVHAVALAPWEIRTLRLDGAAVRNISALENEESSGCPDRR